MLDQTRSGWLAARFIPLVALVTLTACGGGDDNNDSGNGAGLNQAPTANAGSDTTVEELTTVTLDGTASSDPENDGLSYSWVQTAGTALGLNSADSAQPTFDAPDVAFGVPEDFSFELTVSDGEHDSTDTVTITVMEPGPDVTISGVAEYEFVPANNNCIGLAFASTRPQFIRGATVQVFDANTDTELASTVTNDNGEFSFVLTSQIDVYLRVRAELKRTGPNFSWDVDIRDNTTFDPNGEGIGQPTRLENRPLYVLDTAEFNTGVVNSNRNILATTGWDGSQYSGPRAAAPFAILDVVYDAMQLILSADPNANFPALDVYWSVNNNTNQGSGSTQDRLDSGDIGGSFYFRNGGASPPIGPSIALVGMVNNDTEEFDDHVIAHEWGHYFEDQFSRSDSIGGPHGVGDKLDKRLAFGEGWGTALSGMSTGSPIYCDTGGNNQAGGFEIDIESPNALQEGTKGWFNELTILALLYDLWDVANDGVDNDSMGFQPIFDVMTDEQIDTQALTSIFTFMNALKTNNPSFAPFIDSLLADANITTALDDFGSTETNDGDNFAVVDDVIPVYHTLSPDGSVVNVCSNTQFDDDRAGNKLSERQFLRLDIPSTGNYQFVVENSSPSEVPPLGFDCDTLSVNDPNAHRYSDPDYFVYRNGSIVAGAASCTPNEEPPATFRLLAGTHAISLLEFRYADEDTISSYPDRTCFNISVTPQ